MNHFELLRAQAKALSVPAPGEAAAAVSAALADVLRLEMAAQGGAIPFSRFMEQALYAPGLGYYSAGSTKLGEAGDFVTAPEISSLFSRSLARQCEQVLRNTGGDVLEFGAGRGVMAADILLELESHACLPERYSILEVSADLRERQRETLLAKVPHLLGRVQWLEVLPAEFTGVMIGNEVIDAMPVELFHVGADGVSALGVAADGERFSWCKLAAKPELERWYQQLASELDAPLPEGYVSEANLVQARWLSSVLGCLTQGVLLLIDYGFSRREYFLPERETGTLMCHYRHHAHPDPLVLVGLQDLTAHVDFTALAEQALLEKSDVLGYTSQGHFLTACGILELAEKLAVDTRSQLELAAELKRLLMPYEMGEKFKLLAVGKNFDQPLLGFAMNDMRHRL